MSQKHLSAVLALLSKVAAQGELEPEQERAIRGAVRKLAHAIAVRDLRRIEQAVDEIARQFLRVDWE